MANLIGGRIGLTGCFFYIRAHPRLSAVKRRGYLLGYVLLMRSINRLAIAGKRSRLGRIGRMLYRICWLRRICSPLVVTWTKWQMKLMGNLRPKLPGYVPSHVGADAEPGPFGRGAKAPFVAGMIEIAQGLGAGRSQPLGIVGYQVAGVAVRDKGVPQGVYQPPMEAALSQTVIAGVLPENRGIKKSIEKISRDVVQERHSISFAKACNALSKSGIIVGCLGKRSVPAGVKEIHRFEAVFHEQVELFISVQRAQRHVRLLVRRMDSLDFQLSGESRHQLVQGTVILVYIEYLSRAGARRGYRLNHRLSERERRDMFGSSRKRWRRLANSKVPCHQNDKQSKLPLSFSH
jgi:hypothetical protein